MIELCDRYEQYFKIASWNKIHLSAWYQTAGAKAIFTFSQTNENNMENKYKFIHTKVLAIEICLK